MKLPDVLIKDAAAFKTNMTELKRLFHVNASLPEQVFASGFNRFAFEEFDWAMSDSFWPAIQELAASSQDSSLLMAVLDPDPEGYYMKEFGYYNWARVPVAVSSEDYWALLEEYPDASPADSFLVNSEKIIWLPQSANWAVWGQRSYGVCVLGCREHLPVDSWHTVEWALDYMANCFQNRIVPSDFAAKLRLNFGAPA